MSSDSLLMRTGREHAPKRERLCKSFFSSSFLSFRTAVPFWGINQSFFGGNLFPKRGCGAEP